MNCERNSYVSGTGALHLENYSFAHQVYGQIPAILRVLRPEGMSGTIGFTKRFGVGFFQRAVAEPDQRCDAAKKLLADFHAWLRLFPFPRYPHLDRFAAQMFRSITDAGVVFCAVQEERHDANEQFNQKFGLRTRTS